MCRAAPATRCLTGSSRGLSISVEGVDGAPLAVQFLRTGTNGTEFGSGTLLLGATAPPGGMPA